MKRLMPIVAILLLGILHSYAKDTYAVEIQAGKKVLNVSALDLPPTTKLAELLSMFPELLAREGDTRMENFDLQIDDVSTGNSKEALLEQIYAYEIDKIEVVTSPDMSQQKNSQGGVINLLLKPMEEGFTGTASVEAGSMLDIMPSAIFNYKKGKVQLNASLTMEYYQPYDNVERVVRRANDLEAYQYDTIDNKYGSERASVTMKYMPNERHTLKVWAWESYDKDYKGKETTCLTGLITTKSSGENTTSSLSVNAGANYQLHFRKGLLEIEAIYAYNPAYNDVEQTVYPRTLIEQYNCNTLSQSLSGQVKYKYMALLDKDRPGEKCDITGGLRYSYNPNSLEYGHPDNLFKATSDIMHLAPYVEADAVWGRFFAKGGVNYLIYWKNIEGEGYDSYNASADYLTGYLNLGMQVAPHNHLSLIMKRDIHTPSGRQLYPSKVYIPDMEEYYKGNPDLEAELIQNVDLNYIYDHAWTRGNKITVDVSLQYIRSRNLINSYTEHGVVMYANNGKSDIGTVNLMLLYNSDVFSVNFTGNVFNNWNSINGSDDEYAYYNLGLTPSLNFSNTWLLSATFVYNSRIRTNTTRLSDYFYSQVRVARCWKDWTLSLSLLDNFHSTAQDEIFNGEVLSMKYYNLHRPCFSLGVHRKF